MANIYKRKVIKENGKTFSVIGNSYTRIPDEKWNGKHTNYARCKLCKRLVSKQWRQSHKYNNHTWDERHERGECF